MGSFSSINCNSIFGYVLRARGPHFEIRHTFHHDNKWFNANMCLYDTCCRINYNFIANYSCRRVLYGCFVDLFQKQQLF
ncbi:unnamed protein product [Rotaria socialis]|uniref:Uncharacterized protein n=1 Tax=Rotaria socialis TaxID=392032 RepID=A0A817WA61_9BILA|nr:unnamed protein product [Rotaria socialis]